MLHRLPIPLLLCALLLLSPRIARADDLLVSYLDRYHRLATNDIQGRLDLAQWCRANRLYQQQAELLTEVLKLQPGHVDAYRDLIDADARRSRPIDKAWAGKLKSLIDPRFELHHSLHFTIVHDTDASVAALQAEAMEQTYLLVYREAVAIGLRPMPPQGRLVCILFARYDDYRDYLDRYEGLDAAWTAGHYSWRTNRAAFFHDQDNPVFKDVRDRIAQSQQRISDLRAQMHSASATAARIQIQEELKRENAALAEMTLRLSAASQMATLSKTRHEATHQVLFNSGLHRRGREYPFWLVEGLATLFELADKQGNAGPRFVNTYRLETYRAAQKDKTLLALPELLVDRPTDTTKSQEVSHSYAQAWALMHFLWNRRPTELVAFMDSLEAEGTPRNWLGHFKKHFGNDLPSLESDLRRHIDAMPALR